MPPNLQQVYQQLQQLQQWLGSLTPQQKQQFEAGGDLSKILGISPIQTGIQQAQGQAGQIHSGIMGLLEPLGPASGTATSQNLPVSGQPNFSIQNLNSQGQQITIQQGQTLSGLAQQYGTTVQELMRLNPQIQNPDLIFAGAHLTVPGGQQQQQQFALQTPQQLAQIVNQRQQQIAEQLPKEVPANRQDELLESILAGLQQIQPPQMLDRQGMFASLRSELGLDPLETRLNELDAERDRLQVEALTAAGRERDRPVGLRSIEKRLSKVDRATREQLAFLDIERTATARQIDSKLAVIDMTMKFADADYKDARAMYEDQYSRQLQMLDIFFKLEAREERRQDRITEAEDRARKNAQANMNTVVGLLQDSGKSFADLDEDSRRQFRMWEMEVGLPVGTYERLFNQQKTTNEKILTSGSRIAPDGTQFFDILWQRADGSRYMESLPRGAIRTTGSSGGEGFTIKNIPGDLRLEIVQNIRAGADLAMLLEFYQDVQFEAIMKLWEESR